MSPRKPDRAFLDANVLFSAAYLEDSGLQRLWSRKHSVLLTSGYAAEEARHNLETDERRERLTRLLKGVEVLPEAGPIPGSDDWQLPEKDVPIMAAAIQGGATHLITGDVRHFGHLMGTRVGGVLVMRPATFLTS